VASGSIGTLMLPSRRLIREGPLIKSCAAKGFLSKNQAHIRIFFLFSDILLWTTSSSTYRGHVELTGASALIFGGGAQKHKKTQYWVDDQGGKEPATSIELRLQGDTKKLTVTAASKQDHQAWLDDLNATIEEHNVGKEEARKRRTARRKLGGHQKKGHRQTHSDVHSVLTASLAGLDLRKDSRSRSMLDDKDSCITESVEESESLVEDPEGGGLSTADVSVNVDGGSRDGGSISLLEF